MFDRWAEAGQSWPQSSDEARWGIPGVLACFFGAQVLAVVWAVMASGVVYGSDPIPAVADRPIWTLLLFNLGLWVGYLVFPIVARRVSGSGPMKDFRSRVDLFDIGFGALVGVATQLALLPVLYWFVLKVISGDPDSTAEAFGDRVNNSADIVLFGLAVIVVAPIVEEWFFRGMLLPTLSRRFGVVAGIISSSVVFALVHREVILLPGLFCFALILAWLTAKSGRIGPAIVAHMAFNATTVVQLLAL
ncbi:MAG: lysostaphin resistance A-like protein [Acidimicrobiales bacterium]